MNVFSTTGDIFSGLMIQQKSFETYGPGWLAVVRERVHQPCHQRERGWDNSRRNCSLGAKFGTPFSLPLATIQPAAFPSCPIARPPRTTRSRTRRPPVLPHMNPDNHVEKVGTQAFVAWSGFRKRHGHAQSRAFSRTRLVQYGRLARNIRTMFYNPRDFRGVS